MQTVNALGNFPEHIRVPYLAENKPILIPILVQGGQSAKLARKIILQDFLKINKRWRIGREGLDKLKSYYYAFDALGMWLIENYNCVYK
jgi:hypothetical protein